MVSHSRSPVCALALVAVLAVTLGPGCGESTPAPDAGPADPCEAAAAAGPATVELGAGESTFIELNDGDTVDPVCGTQGGVHIWGAVRASGLDLTNVTLDFNQELDGDLLGASSFPFDLSSTDGEKVGVTAFFGTSISDPGAIDLEMLMGQTITFTVTASDTCGNSATDSRQVVMGKACFIFRPQT
jgi:hypothetical protein